MAGDLVLLGDPVIAAVTTQDTGEPVVDAADGTGLRVDGREAPYNPLLRFVRSGLRDRLVRAAASLPSGVHLLLIEGYRPPAVQLEQFTAYADLLRERNPEWTAERVRREASRFISPPEVAPHCTGGAIDLTLCADDGGELDMGTEVNASPVASANRCYTAAPDIQSEAAANRRLLVTTLRAVGLVNYPTEWWHWSYGDRYWAYTTGGSARYAPLNTDQLVPPG
ncbi:M15 family metallopeptidase [Cryptosporangium minutisporangium]|uniref:M15 family metallopeptidase n=1 Tax=Cryptosporangium minutisporangium TaxID=113569 RepID=UPI0035E55916